MATIHSTTRHNGIAGQYALDAVVSYPGYSDEMVPVTFVSSTYGAPIVMACAGFQTHIDSRVLDRIGRTLDESWVRRFFGDA